ncbi:FxSxx-COOH cyclophane-containing RiPP peptide [Streptomyces sp. R41]|uniref:FxSxx-COOH cyclophane-containing RiPP peptide n=1 Tax=Streptomyces sp. R41 TaxID=3238632 RepID=A0AB39RCW0_9ACTN
MAVAEGVTPAEPRTGEARGPAPDAQSVVLDIAGLALEDVAALPDSVLGALLRRVHESCAAGDPFVTGHTESA